MSGPSWWNDARAARAMWLYNDGNSASVIADEMRAPSKNAVIGKLARLEKKGVFRRHERQPGRPRGEPMLRPSSPITTAPLPQEPKGAPGSIWCGLLEIPDGGCRWPRGTGPYKFCGAPTETQPYCTHHAIIAYRVVSNPQPGGYQNGKITG